MYSCALKMQACAVKALLLFSWHTFLSSDKGLLDILVTRMLQKTLHHDILSGGGAEDVSCNFNRTKEVLLIIKLIKLTHSINGVSCDIFCKVIIVDKNTPAHIIAAERKCFIPKLLCNAGTSLLGDRLNPCPQFGMSSL